MTGKAYGGPHDGKIFPDVPATMYAFTNSPPSPDLYSWDGTYDKDGYRVYRLICDECGSPMRESTVTDRLLCSNYGACENS